MANCLHTTAKSDKFNLQMRTGKNVINGRWAYINPYNNIYHGTTQAPIRIKYSLISIYFVILYKQL